MVILKEDVKSIVCELIHDRDKKVVVDRGANRLVVLYIVDKANRVLTLEEIRKIETITPIKYFILTMEEAILK
jgi:hypothetical protein